MNLITVVLALLVALEFIYIMYLETFDTVSEETAKTFDMSLEDLENENVKSLLKNQGIYNGALSVGILYAAWATNTSLLIAIMLYIIVVAIYGGFSVDKAIFVKQGGLAIATLISLLV